MILCSDHFDLGRDKTRMKDPRDAPRQKRTVETILERFYQSRASGRFEIQILADEVGMGNTFVALAVAYSILAQLKSSRIESDMEATHRATRRLVPLATQSPGTVTLRVNSESLARSASFHFGAFHFMIEIGRWRAQSQLAAITV